MKRSGHCKASLCIVEDDPAIRKGLSDVLVFNGYGVESEEDGAKGLEMILTGQYDLVLLDVMLPTMDGFTICRKIRKTKPSQAVIMITAKGAEDDIVTGFQCGADDYIPKPFSLRELMVRVEAVLRRTGRYHGDEVIEYRGIVFDGRNLWASCGEASVDLTRREMDIISYLYRHQDRIVSKKDLLVDVWHYTDATIETRTVDIHMLKLRKKLLVLGDYEDLIATIRGEGYRLENEKT
jgi:DNA-binding response OmpR family regulator